MEKTIYIKIKDILPEGKKLARRIFHIGGVVAVRYFGCITSVACFYKPSGIFILLNSKIIMNNGKY